MRDAPKIRRTAGQEERALVSKEIKPTICTYHKMLHVGASPSPASTWIRQSILFGAGFVYRSVSNACLMLTQVMGVKARKLLQNRRRLVPRHPDQSMAAFEAHLNSISHVNSSKPSFDYAYRQSKLKLCHSIQDPLARVVFQ